MIYCTKCGVEVEPEMSACPICNQPVLGKEQDLEKPEGENRKSTSSGKRNWNGIKQYLADRIPPFKRIFHI